MDFSRPDAKPAVFYPFRYPLLKSKGAFNAYLRSFFQIFPALFRLAVSCGYCHETDVVTAFTCLSCVFPVDRYFEVGHRIARRKISQFRIPRQPPCQKHTIQRSHFLRSLGYSAAGASSFSGLACFVSFATTICMRMMSSLYLNSSLKASICSGGIEKERRI